MLDAGIDDHKEARAAFACLFAALLSEGYDAETVQAVMSGPAAFLNVKFIPMDVH